MKHWGLCCDFTPFFTTRTHTLSQLSVSLLLTMCRWEQIRMCVCVQWGLFRHVEKERGREREEDYIIATLLPQYEKVKCRWSYLEKRHEQKPETKSWAWTLYRCHVRIKTWHGGYTLQIVCVCELKVLRFSGCGCVIESKCVQAKDDDERGWVL